MTGKQRHIEIPNRWNIEEWEFLKQNYGILTYNELSLILKRAASSIKKICIKHKIAITKKDIKENKKQKIRKGRKRVFFNENYFESPNLLNSYWAGFIAADGNISANKKALSIQIGDKDFEHLKKFIENINFTGKISRYIRKNGVSMCNVHFISSKICQDLWNNFGIGPQKTFTILPPQNLSYEQELSYIIGYIDGDGYISIVNRKKYPNLKYLRLGILGREQMCFWFRNKLELLYEGSYKFKNNISKDDNIWRFSVSRKSKNQDFNRKIN